VALKRAGFMSFKIRDLLGGGVLGDSLGSLRDGVLGKLTREEESASSLNLSGRDGGLLVDLGQSGGLATNTVKDVVDKGVHDRHGLGGDSLVGVDLLQDLVDVDAERLLSGFSVLAGTGGGLGGFGNVLGHSRCFLTK